MYSFDPLPIVDTLNSHGGFWFMLFVVGVFIVFSFTITIDTVNINYSDFKAFFIVLVLGLTLLGYIGYESWTTGKITVPKNEKVIGTLKGFHSEGEAYTERSGKQTVRRENHYLYVTYAVEGQYQVTFRANPGVKYPELAVLYKN